jgi:hypothetical protein
MSMEDILKVLVDSRQQPTSQQGTDSMTDLIGSLLGGGQPQVTPQGSGSQQGGLGDMLGVLEMVMGNQSGQSNLTTNDPIMALLQPYVKQLANKMNISPEIAVVVISFVVHKLLSHHPTSGRDSNSFNLDDMFQQMSQGNVDPSLLQSSGMVRELSRKTGLDEATTEQSLQLALGLVGKTVGSMISKSSAKPSSTASKGKSLGKGLKPMAKNK